ncbi:epoxyqueuosine reductase [Anaerosporobacter sp.]
MNEEYNGNRDASNPVLSNVSKEQLRQIILDYGAHVCGFADIDRFGDAPKGFHPCDIYSECQSVVVFGVALPKGLYKVDSRFIYGHFNYDICNKVNEIAYKIAILIEREYGGTSVPIPADGPYEYWDAENLEGRGLLSMKHMAVQAGIGTMGKNTLFINEIYGNRLTLGCVLTNVKVNSDTYAEPLCLPNCNECIESCPSEALHIGGVTQKKCRMNAYGSSVRGYDTVECNRCRTICPMRFGASVV